MMKENKWQECGRNRRVSKRATGNRGKRDVFVSSFPFSVHLIFLINLMLLPFVTTLWQFGHYSDLLVFSKLKKLTYGHL